MADQPQLNQKSQKEPEVTLFAWEGPIRPVVKHTRDFWMSLVAMGGVIGLVFYIIEGIMPVILIIALGFLYFVFSTVKPQQVSFAITNKGVKIADQITEWEFLYRYWFSYWMGNSVLILQTAQMGGRLELVINKEDMDKIRKALNDYLDEETTPPTNIDKFAIWFSENMDRRKKTSS